MFFKSAKFPKKNDIAAFYAKTHNVVIKTKEYMFQSTKNSITQPCLRIKCIKNDKNQKGAMSIDICNTFMKNAVGFFS